jgi:signal transduction histidine kinase/CheY-like chemotaxis protein
VIEKWGIRARVTLVAFIPMLVVAALMTATHTSLRLGDLDDALRARAQAYVRQTAAASEYALFAGDHRTLQQLLEVLMLEDDMAGVAIVDRDGTLLARAGALELAPPAHRLRAAASAGAPAAKRLRIVEPIQPRPLPTDEAIDLDAAGDNAIGTLFIEMSLERLDRRRAELLWIAAGWMVVVAAGSLALARRMSRTVSGPIRNVADTVLRIGRGELDHRVPVSGGGSLRALAEGVNEMAARLSIAHASMSRQIEEATAELRARRDEAERASIAKSRFLAAASHDLRQPLHALGLFLSELSQQRLDERSRELTDKLTLSAEAMDGLLDSLLEISRLDAGALSPVKRSFDLRERLERLVDGQSAAAAERGLELHLRCPPCRGHTDPLLLDRILGNLLANAIRYTRCGRILVACRRRGAHLRVEVRDSGPGIAAEAQKVIFDEFVQLDNPERSHDKGLGLGLSIVRRLTDLLRLPLSLRSRPGLGSVFAIELPAACTQGPPRRETRALDSFEGVCVLLADDARHEHDALAELLASWGCVIDDAHAPVADAPRPEILIADQAACGATAALELLARIRARPGLDTLPAILLDDAPSADRQARARAAGAHLLGKPVRPARLRALMHRLLGVDDGPPEPPA